MKHHFLFTFIVLTVACSRCWAVQPSLWLWLSGHSEEAFSEIDAHKDIISQVSYGAYSVGSDGSLTGKVNLTIIKGTAEHANRIMAVDWLWFNRDPA